MSNKNKKKESSKKNTDSVHVVSENDDYSVEDTNKVEDNLIPAVADAYLDDDEGFLSGDDTIISESDVLSLFKQSDNVVSYEIVNFHNENGKPRSRMSLRNDPPILHISSSDGQSADFILTQNFTKNTASTLREIDRAYSGVSSTKKKKVDQEEIQGNFNKVKTWVINNKIKAGTLSILIVLFVVYTIIISF